MLVVTVVSSEDTAKRKGQQDVQVSRSYRGRVGLQRKKDQGQNTSSVDLGTQGEREDKSLPESPK